MHRRATTPWSMHFAGRSRIEGEGWRNAAPALSATRRLALTRRRGAECGGGSQAGLLAAHRLAAAAGELGGFEMAHQVHYTGDVLARFAEGRNAAVAVHHGRTGVISRNHFLEPTTVICVMVHQYAQVASSGIDVLRGDGGIGGAHELGGLRH